MIELAAGLVGGLIFGLVIMAAVGLAEWERGFRAGRGDRPARDREVRERLAARYLGRAA